MLTTGEIIQSLAEATNMSYLIAPVPPTLPKPSAIQFEVPKVAGPETKFPLSASCQQEGKKVSKVSKLGTAKYPQVVKEISVQGPVADPKAL